MNSLTLPVIHPAFQNLKRNGRWLHLIAGGLIVIHAFSHYRQPNPSPVYLSCLLLIALDIFILVFAVRNLLTDLPRVNLFFRIVEALFFLIISAEMFLHNQWLIGSTHLLLFLACSYLFYCEKKLTKEEYVGIYHTGVNIPSLPESRFLLWSQINAIEATYDTIVIHTSNHGSYEFQLTQNLQFEELDRIQEFRSHYLGLRLEA